MTRALITGMSGAGKSSVIHELARRGFDAIDLATDDWCEWTIAPRPGDPSDAPEHPDWIWREDRVNALLAAPPDKAAFHRGMRFKPEPVLRREIAQNVREVEPLLRQRATTVWDSSMLSVNEVADRLSALVIP